MNDTKKDLRKLWTIQILLDGKSRIQKDIAIELTNIGQLLGESANNPLINISDADISLIITNLDKIVKREEKKVPGKNMNSYSCSLYKNIETFVNILLEITNSKVSDSRKSFFGRCLINSEYGKLFINDELIPNLLKHYNLPELNLETSEKIFITKMLQASPLALNYLTFSILNQNSEYQELNVKERLLMMLQTLLSLDLIDPFSGIMYSSYPYKISFKTIVSFSSEHSSSNEIKYPELKIGINQNRLESYIDHTTYSKKIGIKMIIEAYLNTYNASDNPEYVENL